MNGTSCLRRVCSAGAVGVALVATMASSPLLYAQSGAEPAATPFAAAEPAAAIPVETYALLQSLQLPVAAVRARESGVRHEQIQVALQELQRNGAAPAEAAQVLDAEAEAVRARGTPPPVGLGEFVRAQVAAGLRGPDLAAAIHRDRANTRGDGAGREGSGAQQGRPHDAGAPGANHGRPDHAGGNVVTDGSSDAARGGRPGSMPQGLDNAAGTSQRPAPDARPVRPNAPSEGSGHGAAQREGRGNEARPQAPARGTEHPGGHGGSRNEHGGH